MPTDRTPVRTVDLVQRPHRQLLADSVYEAVKALVMDDVLAPGQRVSIDRLARELLVSPTPLREALARLESDGLVRKEPMRGYSVTPTLTAREFDELYEFRLLIEPWAARYAAERASRQHRQAIRAELDRFPAVGPDSSTGYASYRALADHDSRLHALVMAAAGNTAVARAYERTRCHLHLFRFHYRPDVTQQTLDEHRNIVTAVVGEQADAAKVAMTEHILRSRERLREAVRRT